MHFSMPPPHARLRSASLALACPVADAQYRHAAAPPVHSCRTSRRTAAIAIHRTGPGGHALPLWRQHPDTGFDCSGLIGYVYRHRVSCTPRTVAQLNDWGQPVGAGELRTGDLVVFGTGRRPTPASMWAKGASSSAPSGGGGDNWTNCRVRHWSRRTHGLPQALEAAPLCRFAPSPSLLRWLRAGAPPVLQGRPMRQSLVWGAPGA